MISVTWLGHSTCVIDIDGTRLITDPLLERHAGVLRQPGLSPGAHQYADVDAVLLSHLHHDHAEVSSLRRLRSAPVITAAANVGWVQRATGARGFAPAHSRPCQVGDGVWVALAPAQHSGRPMPHRPNAATGHVVSGPSGTVWFAGDTGLFAGLGRVREIAGGPVDLALVPIGGWGRTKGPGHMGPDEAARACGIVGARWVLPIHWGTLHFPFTKGRSGWMQRPLNEFALALRASSPATDLLGAEVGMVLTVPGE